MTDAFDPDGLMRPPGPTAPPATPRPPTPTAEVPSTPPEPTIEEQAKILVADRGYSLSEALELATTWRCEQCECAIGADRKDDCECPCHCSCCCAGLFRCFLDCECEDDCHYDPDAPEPSIAAPSPSSNPTEAQKQHDSSTSSAQEPPRSLDHPIQLGNEKGERKQAGPDEVEGDDEMLVTTAPSPAALPFDKLYERLNQILNSEMHDDDSVEEAGPYAAACFRKLYSEALQNGMKAKQATALPDLSDTESKLLVALIQVLVVTNASLQKFKSAITDVVRTSFRSTWKLERILADRRATVNAPPAAGPNAWGKKIPATMQDRVAADTATFRFDTTVYSGEEIERMRKLCSENHSFAETNRKPIGDEWTVIMGIMSGTIAVRVLPQFLKRCCNMMQFQWFHYQMVVRAEGELVARLPSQAKTFDYNQTAKRLAETILAAVDYQNMDRGAMTTMLQAAKTLSYNDELKSIHIYFDSKHEAIQWEGVVMPFRNFKVLLTNPDARYREVKELPTGERKITFRQPRDGLQDNRYDSHYILRFLNVTRTMEIDKFSRFLQQLTADGIKMGAPIDSYGANSDFSLTWDFFAHSHVCPPALKSVNRIMWREHAILLLHQGKTTAAPCHQCAEIGHQASNCPKPEAEWFSETTLIVTEEMISAIKTNRRTWTTPEEAKLLFEAMGDPAEQSPVSQGGGAPVEDKTTDTAASVPDTERPANGSAAPEATPATAPDNSRQTDAATPLHRVDNSNAPTNPTSAESLDATKPSGSGTASSAPAEPTGTTGTVLVEAQPPVPPISAEWKTMMSRFSKNKSRQGQQLPARHAHANKKQEELNGPNHGTNQRQAFGQNNRDMKTARGAGETSKDTSPATAHKDQPEEHKSETGQDERAIGTDSLNEDKTKSQTKTKTKTKNKNKNKNSSRVNRAQLLVHREDEEALEAAIDRSNMERIAGTIMRKANPLRPALDTAACLAALQRARADSARITTSRNGTVEAINGKISATPATGNCLYLAIAEALTQRTFASKQYREELLECTMLTKFLIYLAYQVDADMELDQVSALAVLDCPADEIEKMTPTERNAKLLEHYAAVATSSCELNYTLPQHLWGRTDSLRLLAKGLKRSIYVMFGTSDPNIAHHLIFQPQRIKDRKTNQSVATGTILQLGYQEWLATIQLDVENNETPIVLSHANDHYNSVLVRGDDTPPTLKNPLKEPTLIELWGKAPLFKHSTLAETTKTEEDEAAERGPTREQLIESQSSVHQPEVFRALSQDNWSRSEKKAAIDALVLGQDRLKELLVFWEDNATMKEASEDSEDSDEDAGSELPQGSDSSFSPPEEMEVISGGSMTSGASTPDSQPASSTSISSYVLPTPPAQVEYGEWAQQAWSRIVDEWAGQDGVNPPRLADGRALAKFAATYPDVMSELGRQHPNPLIVLEHFKDEGIKGWCAEKRLRYCLDELTHVIAAIADENARQTLTHWRLHATAQSDYVSRLSEYRNKTSWTMLRAHAADLLKARPLLSLNFMKDCAFVCVLDELFPELAADILRARGLEHDANADLIQVYSMKGPFAQALDRAIKRGKWEPIADYLRSLGTHLSQPEKDQVGVARC